MHTLLSSTPIEVFYLAVIFSFRNEVDKKFKPKLRIMYCSMHRRIWKSLWTQQRSLRQIFGGFICVIFCWCVFLSLFFFCFGFEFSIWRTCSMCIFVAFHGLCERAEYDLYTNLRTFSHFVWTPKSEVMLTALAYSIYGIFSCKKSKQSGTHKCVRGFCWFSQRLFGVFF